MSNLETAQAFFDACDTGKGWAECEAFCTSGATFSCQSQTLADIHRLDAYTEWMKNLLVPLPDGKFEIKGFAEDTDRGVVLASAVITAIHSGEGGPVPATGNKVSADYVYSMEFAGGKISHMTKIWNDAETLKALGWA
ncbi:MAG: nuclear transport factor 2 family protein [Pseudomonadota bacterium]